MNPDESNRAVDQSGAEPVAGRSTVPIWLIMVFGLLFYWGQLFLAENAGGFNKDVYNPYQSSEDVAAANPQDPGAKLRAEGLRIFSTTCAACHQASGLGNPGNNVPPLAGSEWVLAEGGNRIARVVLYGLTGPISVKGQEFNGGTMLPWRDTYSDDQIAAVLTYIRSQWGNTGGPIEPQVVKAARADARPSYETADELLKMPVK
jgi:mono/diheme cytochrome c family protein